MLLRDDRSAGRDVKILIPQPAHAWVSGQLARQWGNETFGSFAPREEVCLAAEQHDVGFLEWEAAPTLDTGTGLPHSFVEMPPAAHLDIWRRSVRHMEVVHRYAGLLVSLHVTMLCDRHLQKAAPSARAILNHFLAEQRRIQSRLKQSLRADPLYEASATEESIARNQRLIAAWDWMSLVLLLGFEESRAVEEVPAARGSLTVTLALVSGSPSRISVAPWPFRVAPVELVYDGKRLDQTFEREDEMRTALREKDSSGFKLVLCPVESAPAHE